MCAVWSHLSIQYCIDSLLEHQLHADRGTVCLCSIPRDGTWQAFNKYLLTSEIEVCIEWKVYMWSVYRTYWTVVNSGYQVCGYSLLDLYFSHSYKEDTLLLESENKDIFCNDGLVAATSSSLFKPHFSTLRSTPTSPSSTESRSIRQMRSCLYFRWVWTYILI